jgi:hypothetical protein
MLMFQFKPELRPNNKPTLATISPGRVLRIAWADSQSISLKSGWLLPRLRRRHRNLFFHRAIYAGSFGVPGALTENKILSRPIKRARSEP